MGLRKGELAAREEKAYEAALRVPPEKMEPHHERLIARGEGRAVRKHINAQPLRDRLTPQRVAGLSRKEVLDAVTRLRKATAAHVGREVGLPPQLSDTGARFHLDALVSDGLVVCEVDDMMTTYEVV
jgi:hypothetical protein